MTEEFIHYLWRFQLIKLPLKTVYGEEVAVLHTGQLNTDAGPDFLDARIRIDNTLWAGDVELHVKSSDWHHHGHSDDRSYDGVILHVVYLHDSDVERPDRQLIPSLELKGTFDELLFEKYEGFLTSLGWIPCERSLTGVHPGRWQPWLYHLATERIGRRSLWIDRLFTSNNGHAELTLYHCLGTGFGQKINTTPFEWLVKSVDVKTVMRLQDDLLQLEALFFGQAGFLEGSFSENYPLELKEQYSFLQRKFDLRPLLPHVWKFLRMRPSGFPTLRIAHWAVFVHHHIDKLNQIPRIEKGIDLLPYFEQETSAYWQNHYHFERKSTGSVKRLGMDSVLAIILNSILPFLYVKAVRMGDKAAASRAVTMMESFQAEDNAVVRGWINAGVPCHTALESQALLELKNQYCDRKNCLHCSIGSELIRGG
ncbi:MAG: DUF2851 family protein [Bacteroidetes bacterium]|nr:DUF2851 family protein [Bacteroidota bacterium]